MNFLSQLWTALTLVMVVVGAVEAQTVKVNEEYLAKLPNAEKVPATIGKSRPDERR